MKRRSIPPLPSRSSPPSLIPCLSNLTPSTGKRTKYSKHHDQQHGTISPFLPINTQVTTTVTTVTTSALDTIPHIPPTRTSFTFSDGTTHGDTHTHSDTHTHEGDDEGSTLDLTTLSSLPDSVLSMILFDGYFSTPVAVKYSTISKRMHAIISDTLLTADFYCNAAMNVHHVESVVAKYGNLKEVDFEKCKGVTDEAVEWLGGIERTLMSLSLKGTTVTDVGVVSAVSKLTNLTHLDLTKTSASQTRMITDVGLAAVCDTLKNLKSLRVSWCKDITDRGIAAVQQLKHLTIFDASLCSRITNRSCEIMGNMALTMALTEVDIGGCKNVNNNGIHMLLGAPNTCSHNTDEDRPSNMRVAQSPSPPPLSMASRSLHKPTGAAMLLANNCKLTMLGVSHTSANSATVGVMAALGVNLRFLDLGYCDGVDMEEENVVEAVRVLRERGCWINLTVDDVVRQPRQEWMGNL